MIVDHQKLHALTLRILRAGVSNADEAAQVAAAKTHGVAVHGLRNTHHIGRVGTYGEIAARAGLVSIHFVNGASGAPPVAPFRGREGRFLTNPV